MMKLSCAHDEVSNAWRVVFDVGPTHDAHHVLKMDTWCDLMWGPQHTGLYRKYVRGWLFTHEADA